MRLRHLRISLSQEQIQWKRGARALQEHSQGLSLVEGQHHLLGGGEEAEAGQAAEMAGERAWEASEPRLLAAQAEQALPAARWILKPAEWMLEPARLTWGAAGCR